MGQINRLDDTRPVRAVRTRRPSRLLLVALLALLPVLFLCGAGSVVYLLFPPPHIDIVVLGVDSRDGDGWVTRADSIMLIGADPSRLRVSLLSIPRDLSITAPDYGLQRINVVHMLGEMEETGGGPRLMSEAIALSFGVRPERYVRLNFQGFVDVIDAVGGVTIDVERAIVDSNYPTDDYGVQTVRFEPGVQHMDGARALIYARTRYADDDYRRAERQQQVVSALLGKLVNPVYWPAALAVLNRSLDTSLTLWDILALAPTVLVNGGRFDTLVIDRDYITATADGVAIPNYAALEPWIRDRFE